MKTQPGSLRQRRVINALSRPNVADELANALRDLMPHVSDSVLVALPHVENAIARYEADKQRR